MDLTLPIQIEDYLLARPRWVPAAELEKAFGIDERILRAKGKRRGLLAFCAISSDKPGASGFKHIRHATTAEKIRAKHAPRKRLIAAVRAERDYDLALRHATSGKFGHQVYGTGNGVLKL